MCLHDQDSTPGNLEKNSVATQIFSQRMSKRLKDRNRSGIKTNGKQKNGKKEGVRKAHEKEKNERKKDSDVKQTKKKQTIIQQQYHQACSQLIELQKCEHFKKGYRLLQ